MNKPKVFKQGGHLMSDPSRFEDVESDEHMSRGQLLKNIDVFVNKDTKPSTTKETKHSDA